MSLTAEERTELVQEFAEAMAYANVNQLTDEERQWVRLAIEAEARKIKFRDAVIEKTVSGLVWMALVGVGYLIVDFLRNHGLRI
jgi:hypothetical protein